MKTYPERYLNRELSWLSFNQRVLDLAEADDVRLLERVKFLAITGSNLDEFFKVRVGGLRLAQDNNVDQKDISGLNPTEQLRVITSRVRKMNQDQSRIYHELMELLEPLGLRRMLPLLLSERQMQASEHFFDQEICSVVSPIAVERDQPFPLMAHAKLCMCVRLSGTSNSVLGETDVDNNEDRFVVIAFGGSCRRFVNLPDNDGDSFMLVEDVAGMYLEKMFPGQKVLDWATFRITRNADVAVNEDMMNDLLTEMTQLLEARKVSKIIRLELASDASKPIQQFLMESTGADEEMVFPMDAPLDFSALFELASIPGYEELKDVPWLPQPSPDFVDDDDIFETIAHSDRVLIHPYQHFDPVVDFVRIAANDPHVISIKQTLYRTSKNSEVIDALIEAADNGKQVTAVVELKARFDEERNIKGARQLEQAGVDVIYGVEGLKTHAKICIVVRREPRGIQRYVHFGTGNYNESTAKLYGDVSYFTNNEKLGYEAVLFFNAITGLSVPQTLKSLAAAPINLRETLIDFIKAEIGNARKGGACEINAKLNSLVDKQIIDSLYEASQEGIKIRLNIRGICCLKPGVPGLSENIEVVSIVDRLLEHSRIIHFHRGGDDVVFISSADWMGRNLNRRAELLVPIENDDCRQKLLAVLKLYFDDNVRAKKLQSDGSYIPVEVEDDVFRVQEFLYQQACDQYSAFTNPKATVFKALRGESA